MTIQFNTDKNFNGGEDFSAPFITQIESELERFSSLITRVEVHLSDEDGNKDGLSAIRCLLEARIKGKQPAVVTNQADTVEHAVSGSIDKLVSVLDTIIGRMKKH